MVNTRSHPELDRENVLRQWYFALRRGKVGRCQAYKKSVLDDVFLLNGFYLIRFSLFFINFLLAAFEDAFHRLLPPARALRLQLLLISLKPKALMFVHFSRFLPKCLPQVWSLMIALYEQGSWEFVFDTVPHSNLLRHLHNSFHSSGLCRIFELVYRQLP